MGRFLTILLLACTLVAGVALYYLQVYAYYDEVEADGSNDVQLTPLGRDVPQPIAYTDFRAIDSESSPIRYRACFETELDAAMLAETYAPYDRAEPLVAPGWFSCFDAGQIGAALEAGTARAFLGTANIHYGIDRVVAVTDDGQGYVWHQINRCGEIVFDGQPAPDDCPEPPEGF